MLSGSPWTQSSQNKRGTGLSQTLWVTPPEDQTAFSALGTQAVSVCAPGSLSSLRLAFLFVSLSCDRRTYLYISLVIKSLDIFKGFNKFGQMHWWTLSFDHGLGPQTESLSPCSKYTSVWPDHFIYAKILFKRRSVIHLSMLSHCMKLNDIFNFRFFINDICVHG